MSTPEPTRCACPSFDALTCAHLRYGKHPECWDGFCECDECGCDCHHGDGDGDGDDFDDDGTGA